MRDTERTPGRQAVDAVYSEPTFAWRAGYVVGDCLQLLVVGLVLELLLFQGAPQSPVLRLSILGLLLLAVARAQGWCLLVALQANLLLQAPHAGQRLPGVAELLYCLLALGVVAYAYGAPTARPRFSRWMAAQVVALGRRAGERSGATTGGTTGTRTGHDPAAVSLGGRFLAWGVNWALPLLGSVLLAMMLWTVLPLDPPSQEQLLRRSLARGGSLWPGATLLVLALAGGIVCREIVWRQLTPGQARQVLRAVWMLEFHAELRLFVRQALKVRRTEDRSGKN
ncbi:MAG: hypothetical protein KDA45_15350 [Planctomycetales bacterium]|nr:hypothetical protein [Planctomycetales bacterium]